MSDQPTQAPPSKRPPRSVGWRVISAVAAAFAVALVLGVAFAGPLTATFAKARHAVGFGGHPLVQKANADGTTYWTCGMHPWIVLPEPGLCPICNMDLVPLDPAKFSGNVTIDPIVVQNIGVRTQPVVAGPVVKSIRTVGNVTYDETRLTDVNTKFAGWIEGLKVDSVGAPVAKGDVLFEIYSPELYAAQEEYLLASRNAKGAAAAVAEANRQLLESARTRLRFFDLSDAQIAELERRGEPQKTVAVRSPYAGVVIDKMATEGMQVTPGMRVYRIADLSHVWVQTSVYEQQLPFVQQGQSATMTLPYLPGERFVGTVVYVYPYVDEKTRQATVRLQFDNSNGRLKPGMYAEVTLRSELAARSTLAPQSAVIPTGRREVALVSLGKGRFEPRDVTTGVQTDDGMIQVLTGLKPGERVVTSGQFLLDSEARTREALAKMIKGDPAADQKPAVAVATTRPSALDTDAAADLDAAIRAYLAVGSALAADRVDGIAEQAKRLSQAAARLRASGTFAEAETLIAAAGRLERDAGDIKAARSDFAAVSDAIVPLARRVGVPSTLGGEPLQAFHCPMYAGGTRWLQVGGDARNPFMGSRMLECHDEQDAVPIAVVPGADQ